MNEKELQAAKADAERVAREGDAEERAGFVCYINMFISYNKEQYYNTGSAQARTNYEQGQEIYKHYLKAL